MSDSDVEAKAPDELADKMRAARTVLKDKLGKQFIGLEPAVQDKYEGHFVIQVVPGTSGEDIARAGIQKDDVRKKLPREKRDPVAAFIVPGDVVDRVIALAKSEERAVQ